MMASIVKYWIEFLLGVATTGLAYACKKIWSMYQFERKHRAEADEARLRKIIEETYTKSQADDTRLQAEINLLSEKIDTLRVGILSMYGKNFKQECRRLLEEGHKITLKELEFLTIDYDVYHGLGGNGDGNQLFSLVELKAKNDIANP